MFGRILKWHLGSMGRNAEICMGRKAMCHISVIHAVFVLPWAGSSILLTLNVLKHLNFFIQPRFAPELVFISICAFWIASFGISLALRLFFFF